MISLCEPAFRPAVWQHVCLGAPPHRRPDRPKAQAGLCLAERKPQPHRFARRWQPGRGSRKGRSKTTAPSRGDRHLASVEETVLFPRRPVAARFQERFRMWIFFFFCPFIFFITVWHRIRYQSRAFSCSTQRSSSRQASSRSKTSCTVSWRLKTVCSVSYYSSILANGRRHFLAAADEADAEGWIKQLDKATEKRKEKIANADSRDSVASTIRRVRA